MSVVVNRRTIRLPLIEKGWRVMLMYAAGGGALFSGVWWIERLDKSIRPWAFMCATISVFIVWRFLGAVRLELLGDHLRVRKFGLLGRPRHIPYAAIIRVEVTDEEVNVGKVLSMRIVLEDNVAMVLGPWRMFDRYLALQGVEEARKSIHDQAARSREHSPHGSK